MACTSSRWEPDNQPAKVTSKSPRSRSDNARAASASRSRSNSPASGSAKLSRRKSSPKAAKPLSPNKSVVFDHRRTAGEIRRCKKGKRTDIRVSEWGKFGYANKPEVLSKDIEYKGNVVPIPRVNHKDATPEYIFQNYLVKSRPVIIENCCDHWPAMQRWSAEALEERFRNVSFKVAKDDKGKKLRMKFKYYADYLRHQQDDSPLYLFETNVDENGYIRSICNDYEVPDVVPDDWFALINNDARPPFRWFCLGPKRSGTTVHVDPLGTAAWNAVAHGCKRWVLMEPQESKRKVKGKDLMKEGEDDEAIMYFDFILPRIKKEYPEMKIYEGLQNPGDVIIVPGDWWHGVLNLEDTVAVTQNWCGRDNFDLVWGRTRREREKVAWLWLRNMKKFAPKLYDRALAMNKKDGFRMRHERPKGDRLSDADSSSSESSSDSSSDEAVDLDPDGLSRAIPPGTALGSTAFKYQGTGKTPELVTAGKARFDRPNKRPRQEKDDPDLA